MTSEFFDQTVIVLRGELDASNDRSLLDLADSVIDSTAPSVVVDLSLVTFIDLSGYRAIRSLIDLIPPGTEVAVVGMQPPVHRAVRLFEALASTATTRPEPLPHHPVERAMSWAIDGHDELLAC